MCTTKLQVVLTAAGFALLASCTQADRDRGDQARKLFVVEGFDQPESVQYDREQDVYFVSNMFGYGSARDSTGYISWFSAEDPGNRGTLVQSGRNGALLNAPKGLALQGDTLWVADIDVLRAFDKHTGAPLREVDLGPDGALLLNSVAVASDGIVYVSDTGIVMSDKGVLYRGADKILALRPDGSIAVTAKSTELRNPNGIRWDDQGKRLVVASFHPFGGEVYALPDGKLPRTVLASEPGHLDGLGILPDGRVIVTSWNDSSLHVIEGPARARLISGLWQPADLAVDSARGNVAIPLVLPGLVEVWRVP
jgi:sugar lactone lactonase YvrE